VRWPLRLAALAFGVACLCVSLPHAWGQTAPPMPRHAAQGGNIALIDVKYIFEKHARFKMMMDDLKADVERAEAQVQAEREAIKKLTERLENFRGTPEYKAMEEEVTKRQSDLAVQIQLQRKEFLQREARIYYNVYQEILQELSYYCPRNGIDIVLRFSGDPVDVERPDSVLGYINRPVVWYGKDRDITGVILESLNRRFVDPSRMGTRPAPPPAPFQR